MSIIPDWPAPKSVHALTLTKDDSLADLPRTLDIRLLNQVHHNEVITLPSKNIELNADGAYTRKAMVACTLKTADCLAIFLCNTRGTEVAAIHAGWRGLSKGVIKNGIEKFTSQSKNLLAWISPSICQEHYEIDRLVYDAFVSHSPGLSSCFKQNREDHWLCNLREIAIQQLKQLGVVKIFGDETCTFEDEARLYSFRRDKEDSGRLLHIIWKSEL